MNKKLLIISLISAGFIASCLTPEENEGITTNNMDTTEVVVEEEIEEKEIVDQNQTSFGTNKVDTTNAISTNELLAQFKGQIEMDATFKAKINETCAKMGCWVNIEKENGETFMVRFKDHFTIPVDTKVGTFAYLSGKAVQDTVSVDMQRHFLEDANAPQKEIDAIIKIL